LQSASVPVCSTLCVPSPSKPTQKLENVCCGPQVTAGWVQDEDTLVNVPAWPAAAYPDQLVDVAAALAELVVPAWPSACWPAAPPVIG
jgi:hypothetical protein